MWRVGEACYLRSGEVVILSRLELGAVECFVEVVISNCSGVPIGG